MRYRPTLRLLLLAVALLPAGCAGTEEAPIGGQLVIPREGTGVLVDETEAGIEAEAALDRAQAAFREGDPLTAFSIANRALSGHVPSDVADALRALRSKARAALVTNAIVRVRVVPDLDVVVAGDEATARIVFVNRSSADLRVPATATASSQAMIVLDLVRADYDVYGNVGKSRMPLRIPLARDLLIAPGATADVEVTLPASATRFSHQGFAVLSVGGMFRPVVVQVGDSEFFDALPLLPAPIRVFMPNYEQLAEDPLAALQKAVQKRSPPHILTAAELLAPSERDQALAVLVRAADEDPALAFVLDAAAARIKTLSGELTDE